MDIDIDLLSVLIAAALYTIVFYVWYSKWLFGSNWIKCSGIKESDVRKNWGIRIFWNFILGLIMAYFLAFFNAYLNVTSVADGMFVAFCMWLGFVVPTQLFPVIWYKKAARLFFIETGAKLLSLLAMGGIIGA